MAPTPDPNPPVAWTYLFRVDHIHDGDTIYGVLDKGLGEFLGRQGDKPEDLLGLRFYGINAPELSDPSGSGKAALAYLQTLVSPGDDLTVVAYSWDKYEFRIDGTPYTEAGVNLCQAMLDSGNAVPYPA